MSEHEKDSTNGRGYIQISLHHVKPELVSGQTCSWIN